MIMALILVTIFFTHCVFAMWHTANEREIRWKFYALRDKLRALAISNKSISKSNSFLYLDRLITKCCGSLNDISIYTVLFLAYYKRIPIEKLECEDLNIIFDDLINLIKKYIRIRNPFCYFIKESFLNELVLEFVSKY